MKIKMITLMAGPNGSRMPGKIYDVPAQEAETLIAGGYAEKVSGQAAKNVAASPRTADKAPGRRATKQDAEETPPEDAVDEEEPAE